MVVLYPNVCPCTCNVHDDNFFILSLQEKLDLPTAKIRM